MENLNAEKIKKELVLLIDDMPVELHFSHKKTSKFLSFLKSILTFVETYEQKIFELENRLKECENGYEGTLHLERCKLHDAEEKVKELTEENDKLHASCTELARVQEENERLKRICESYALQYGTAADKEVFLKQERAETVRKMLSEIKERCIKGGIYPAFVASTIDEIAKELLGEMHDE